MKQEQLILDLSTCDPADGISRRGRKGTWLAVDYELDQCNGHGVMLFALPGNDAPPLSVPLGVEGWHEIRLGMFYGAGADGLAFWDSYNRYFPASEWAFVKRLGHRNELANWQGKGDDHYRVHPLRFLDGFPMNREFFCPTDG